MKIWRVEWSLDGEPLGEMVVEAETYQKAVDKTRPHIKKFYDLAKDELEEMTVSKIILDSETDV